MKNVRAPGFLAVALAAMLATSHAHQLAYTSKDVNLRAGPSRDYPVVAILPAGISISVEGCLSDYRWCDVVAGPDRGWLYAMNIVYPYQGANVPVLTYGALLGISIIVFSIGPYWDDHYRARPWYPQRQLWIDRPRPMLPPVRPRPLPPGPGIGSGGGHRPPPMLGPGGGERPPPVLGPARGQRSPNSRDHQGARPP